MYKVNLFVKKIFKKSWKKEACHFPPFSILSSINPQTGKICVYSYKNDFSHFIDDIDDVDGIGYRRWSRRKTPPRRLRETQTSQLLSPRFKTPRGKRLRQLRVRTKEKNVKREKLAGVTFKLCAIGTVGENYKRRHSSNGASPIENIFPSAFLNYSHTSPGVKRIFL